MHTVSARKNTTSYENTTNFGKVLLNKSIAIEMPSVPVD